MDFAVEASQVQVVIGKTQALPPTDLQLAQGEVLALMGPSGSGKTTLLDCILALREPTSGRLTVLGCDYATASASRTAKLRRESVGIVTQNPQLLPELSVVENVALPLIFDGFSRRRSLSRGRQALAGVGLDGTADLRPENLSGGEAQRVALARSMVRQDGGRRADRRPGRGQRARHDGVDPRRRPQSRGFGAVSHPRSDCRLAMRSDLSATVSCSAP